MSRQSRYINLQGTPSSPTYLPLPAVEHLLSNSSPTVVRCWFTGEAGDIEQNLRPCIRRRSSNHMDTASTESQNSYLHWTVFPCSKDPSVYSWLISWLTPAPLTRYFHWWIMAPYTNWMNDWLIAWLIDWAGRSMLFMSLRLFDHYDLIRFFQLDVVNLLRCIG